MNQNLTIVMYHYVRDLKGSSYPLIKGLDKEKFYNQLGYIQNNYTPVTKQQIIDAYDGEQLPANAIWLTFDDGYSDHYDVVLPALLKFGIEGAFFPPASPYKTQKLLDVNKIHFILAAQENALTLIDEIKKCLKSFDGLESFEHYYQKWGHANRYDGAEVNFIKRMLQVGLPVSVRHEIADQLFKSYVTQDEAGFSSNLYLSKSQIQEMLQAGMQFGSHGTDHVWLDSLSRAKQKEDIKQSITFMREMNIPLKDWMMCYPYGGYNKDTIKILQDMGCALGVTVESRKASIPQDSRLILPRLDTNDLPQ
ncbi:polysaccharide deacetylase family protein [Temperatibacter marinus]|uniref:Chitooligosaccharide deacetylase n=1 Tax=Temperatibacter marinus TaxID=1456591 RepID=A0AA52EAH3_9PROT|nr:polysaccharide deacetylase family protein [Temperatibacter marinus]WND01712.1 polysaccharide deacetylase family protein [Temperatibacter marinus]